MQAVQVDRRQQLEQERDKLLRKLVLLREERTALAREDVREGGGQVDESADSATGTFELEKTTALDESARRRLYEVEDAIRRIELGTYGRCEQCGRPIDRERLKVLPQTKFCLECQLRWERNGKLRRLARVA
ncbi:MAG: TraR/DksA C4-type zinc finger protein [Chloroflexi bacterium]|nr:TraR/DksA C4-type zinc finger protein [Chloroflexota bacterium]